MPNQSIDPTETGSKTGIEKSFAQAIAAHKSGHLAEAETGYKLVLESRPQESEAHYLLGMIFMATNRPHDAVNSLKKCIDINSTHANALNALGAAHASLQKHEEASEFFSRAAAVSPSDPKTWFNLGRAYSEKGDHEEALEAFERAIQLAPQYWKAVNGAGHCLLELGRVEEALSALRECVQGAPDEKAFRHNLIRALAENGALEEAIAHSRDAIGKWPDAVELRALMATVLQKTGAKEDAVSCLIDALKIDNDNARCLNELANLLYEMGQWKDAEVHASRMLDLDPNSVNALTNMGRIRQMRGDLDGALTLYRKAIEIEPDYGDVHNNLGNLLVYMDQLDGAIQALNKAVQLKPGNAGFIFNRATSYMTKGDIARDWRGYRLRSEKEGYNDRAQHMPWPLWDGEDIQGKRVLGWADQGMGDQILAARYFSEATRLAADAVLECSPRLASLFKRSFKNDLHVVAETTPLDPDLESQTFDYQTTVLDFCCSQFTTPAHIPKVPPLIADKDLSTKLRHKYLQKSGGRPLVGISWASGGTHIAHFKSTELTAWGPILSNPNVTFVDLQYGNLKNDVKAAEERFDISIISDPDIDETGDLDPFAAQVAAMDLVVTISNTTAHMAGALGIHTMTMTPTGPGRLWYWFADGTTTPWYSSMTLFRHHYSEGWSRVIEKVGQALSNAVPPFVTKT